MLGLRHIVCTKEDWYYLLFYDIDKPITQNEIDKLDDIMEYYHCSYLLYKTKNGHHIVGLTPLNIEWYAKIFSNIKYLFNSYYSGDVIRLSRKKDEQQELIIKNTTYGEIIPNLYNLYASRFNYEKMPWIKETAKYLLVFERYRINQSDA